MPLPTDTLLSTQWHLINTTPGFLDLNVAGVWNPNEGLAYTGAGITILAIDDGFDYTHSDLAPNYDTTLDYDFEFNTLDPFGSSTESHGTAVMGIIGAAANGTGVVGIAHEAHLIGYRVEGLINDAWLVDIAQAIGFAATSAMAHVVNISQGIANDENSEFGVGYTASRFDDIEAAIGTAVNDGRGGLGTIIVKSAGNSRTDFYDVNSDDWSNDTRQVVVAAVDQDGFVSDYSSFGAAILVSGFGTPGEVVTTDRVGAAGYDAGDFTSTFNGTSSAAPMVAGVVGLMLEANGDLGWRDVQSILAITARHVGSEVGGSSSGFEMHNWAWNAATTWNGGGMHFSNDYGYGLVDALAAVRLSETWLLGGNVAQTSGNEFSNTIDMLNVITGIPDANPTGVTFNGAAAFDDVVDRVTVTVTFSAEFMADAQIVIISPDGTRSVVLSTQAGSLAFDGTWTFESQAFRGERAGGNWSVQISDLATGDAIVVSDIILRTYGDVSNGDRYVYTNEYSDYSGLFDHVTNVTDTNDGIDTVNASAVTTGSFIRLDGNAGAIDGVLTTFTGMENAIGGDGADTIAGNSLGNMLYGMRGADFFYGYSGNDSLNGGDGGDNLWGGNGADAHVGGGGIDYARYDDANHGNLVIRLDNSALNTGAAAGDTYDGIEGLVGGAGNDTVAGNALNNVLFGSGGADQVFGGAGNDTVLGDAGGDNLWGGAGADAHYGGNDAGVDYARYDDANHGNLTIRLDNSALNTGAAAGDTYSGIEGLVGGAGNDLVVGDGLANFLFGSGGADLVYGGVGNDQLFGDAGGDNLWGGVGADAHYGGTDAGVDYARYDDANHGNLTLRLDAPGSNTGAAAGDTYTGIEGLVGGAGNDVIIGNTAANFLFGQGGADFIDGLAGSDYLNGGAGADRFRFSTALGASNVDQIADFQHLVDDILLVQSIFAGIGAALTADEFRIGMALDANDRILYNNGTGQIFYDSNANGAGGMILFATVTAGTTLTFDDFIMV